MNPLIEEITKSQLRDDIPDFRPGDTVRVHARIVEGTRERIQIFEGVVIKRRGVGISAMYTVRKISNGVGVERTFPLHSPRVEKNRSRSPRPSTSGEALLPAGTPWEGSADQREAPLIRKAGRVSAFFLWCG